MRKKYRELLPEELEALQVFAADYGRKWKEKLSTVYWYNARIYRGRDGKEYSVLHRLRNEFGPSWLAKFKFPVKKDDSLKVIPDYKVWSGKLAPPKVGEKIVVRINNIGEAKVKGYFVQEGYLGLLVSPSNPPEWYVKQNGKKDCRVFGAEIAQ